MNFILCILCSACFTCIWEKFCCFWVLNPCNHKIWFLILCIIGGLRILLACSKEACYICDVLLIEAIGCSMILHLCFDFVFYSSLRRWKLWVLCMSVHLVIMQRVPKRRRLQMKRRGRIKVIALKIQQVEPSLQCILILFQVLLSEISLKIFILYPRHAIVIYQLGYG